VAFLAVALSLDRHSHLASDYPQTGDNKRQNEKDKRRVRTPAREKQCNVLPEEMGSENTK